MPVVEREKPKSNWLWYVLGGCGGGCLILAIVFGIMGYSAYKQVKPLMTGMQAPGSGPYTFKQAQAEKCVLNIPDGSGTVTYMQATGAKVKTASIGYRAVRLNTKLHNGVDCPLMITPTDGIETKVYWYPAQNSDGPYLRLEDMGMESIIDLKRGVSRAVVPYKGKKYAGDMSGDFYSMKTSTANGKSTVVIDGKPADDVTNKFPNNSGKYLGTIKESGGKLTFVPAKSSANKQ